MATIVSISVHPAIGIARVGDSNEWFVGPERPRHNPVPTGGYKDAQGKVKKQAARFRVFATYDTGNVEEYQGQVKWTVELANKKAAAIMFDNQDETETLRNSSVPADQRNKLVIRGSSEVDSVGDIESISGEFSVPGSGGSTLTITLGVLHLESDGQLLVLGGAGKAYSVVTPNATLNSAFNNDLWCDDTCDGKVKAEISVDGNLFESIAWVIVAPPKFAPQLTPIVSLWDRLLDVHGNSPQELSYTKHIWPILERARQSRWVNRDADRHRSDLWGTDPLYDQTLPSGQLIRKYIFETLKGSGSANERMPLQTTIGRDPDGDPDGDRLTDTQIEWMRRWSNDDRVKRDWTGVPDPAPIVTPEGMDQVALEGCVGAALFPGIEAGQFLLQSNIWSEFPRLDDTVVSPGDVTERMALPWHTDFLACRTNWWPVPRPHHIKQASAPDVYRNWVWIPDTLTNSSKIVSEILTTKFIDHLACH